ncbi:MAG: hypothetical protein AB7J40_04755 [Candidatus Altimarinota bacterium]
MNVQELIRHISTWGEAQVQGASEHSEQPEEQYKKILEREMLKRGKVLLNRYQELQQRMQGLEAEKAVLKQQLQDFEKETQQMVDLPTGDQVMIDVSKSPRLQEFWSEARQVLGENASLPAIDLGDLMKSVSTPETLYDPAYLAEESDDLLRYL